MILSPIWLCLLCLLPVLAKCTTASDFSLPPTLAAHPRLMLTPDRVQHVLSMNASDTQFQAILIQLEKAADAAILSPLDTSIANITKTRVKVGNVAGMYLLTSNTAYADWVIAQILALCALPDWKGTQFLDTADISLVVTIGYDWVYDKLSSSAQAIIEQALEEKALQYSFTSATGIGTYGIWANHTNNWAQVTHGTLIMAALAIGDKNPTLAQQYFDFAFPHLLNSLEAYAPDGGWYEQYSYGSYPSTFFTFMLRSLETALGTDLKLTDLPGISNIGSYLAYAYGNTGGFGGADGSEIFAGPVWSTLYFAQRFSNPSWAKAMLSKFTAVQSGTFQALLFYESAFASKASTIVPEQIPLSAHWVNIATTTFRSSWDNAQGWFVGFMGGFNGRSHGHLDAGSFVIDYKGFRWAELLGSDSYSLTRYFNFPDRWTYYRCRTEGANSLSISHTKQTPLHFANQIPSANNSLLASGTWANGGHYGIANLTSAYSNVTNSVLRGVALINGNQVIIRDGVSAKTPIDIATSWHTQAKVVVSSDKRSAMLTNSAGISMTMSLVSPPTAYLELTSTNPCSVYSPCKENTNSAFSNVAVRLSQLTTYADIIVFFAETGTAIANFSTPLSQWKSSCISDCFTGTNVDPYWLRHTEIYYPSAYAEENSAAPILASPLYVK